MSEQSYTVEQVRALISSHAEDWADKPIRELASTGTDNAMFMLGDDAVLRLPKRASAVPLLEKELLWLPKLANLPLAVPKVLFSGKTGAEPDSIFGIFDWISGQIATPEHIADNDEAIAVLACFLNALHAVDTIRAPIAGASNHNRGVALNLLTEKVVASIDILSDEIDVSAATDIWERACAAATASKNVWVHGDLKADNMIANDGQLAAIIDWGLTAVGDPAIDYAAAWSWVARDSRALFQDACDVSEDDWQRAKGWALYTAVIALSYYRGRSHEALCAQSRLTLGNLGLML